MTSVTVCICTYRRSHIRHTLNSVLAQRLPADCELDVVVVDNDEQGFAEPIVEEIAGATSIKVNYQRCIVRNLSAVRNAALDLASGDYIALIDDDEVAGDSWIASLLDTLQGYDADVVFGPVNVQYSSACPVWISRADLFRRDRFKTGTSLHKGHTANVLLTSRLWSDSSIRFDLAYGESGGEDTDYFYRLFLSGARLIFCADANVSESLGVSRENGDYLFAESVRIGQLYSRCIYPRLSPFGKTTALFAIAAKVLVFSVIGVCLSPFGRRWSAFWYYRYLRNVTKLRYLLRKDELVKLYGQ